MIGQTLGHYKILDKLGVGGMGEVYRAEDSTLKRQVALKVLPADLASSQERLDRFQREAETLAALDHPNIVHIHTVEEEGGVRFLTMQLVEGKTLSEIIPKDGMPLEQIFKITTPLADALAAAHRNGVIHRDLKPDNVMIDDEGRLKVLDFGLAKLSHDPSLVSSQLATEPLTQDGLIVGTMPYMSPEQLQGKELDSRSDVFSLGVVLYEMATGERPFKGDTSASLIMSIGRDVPPEVDTVREELPHHLSRVINRCLAKDPERRYQSVKDVRLELDTLEREVVSSEMLASQATSPTFKKTPRRRWAWIVSVLVVLLVLVGWFTLRDGRPAAGEPESTPAVTQNSETRGVEAVTADRQRIVVLPIENLGSPEDEYFADGMTEEITSRLAVVSGLRVISRTSARHYKGNRPSLKQVGEELGVDYVLEGSVRWAKTAEGNRVRITQQLIQVRDDTHLWAETYDRDLADVFEIQSEIAQEVTRELGVLLLESESAAIAARSTDNPDAYQAYLRGIDLWKRWNSVDAVTMFDKAVELDPSFAQAWAKLSRVKLYQYFYWWEGADEGTLAEAKQALEEATELAPTDAQVRVGTGYYYYYGLRDFDRALEEFEAISRDFPNDPEVLEATGTILRRQGHWDASTAAFFEAAALDPQNLSFLDSIARNYRAQRRFEEALATLDRAITLAPDNADLYDAKSEILLATGSIVAARDVLVRAPVTEPMHLAWFSVDLYDRRWEAILERADRVPQEDQFPRLAADYYGGVALLQLGRTEEGRDVLQTLAGVFEGLVAEGGHRWSQYLGEVCSLLGRYEDAVAQAERAIEFWAEDHLFGPDQEETLAWIHAHAGEVEPAVAIFDRLLAIPYFSSITVDILRLDAGADPIRDHPRFQALLEKYGQEVQ